MTTQKNIKTENIIRLNPEDTLTHALSLLSSSHDAGFVFEGNKLLGMINPYYCIIKKSYPANTKVKHCLFHTPKIDINTPLKKVIQMMIESKLHYLPVYENNEFSAIISARRILTSVKDLPEMNIPIQEVIQHKRPLVTVGEKDFLFTALGLFKQFKFSKLVVLTKEGKLKGMLAYYDLIAFLAAPKTNQHQGSRGGRKSPVLKQYIKNYMKTTMLTLTPRDTMNKAIHMILDKKIGSIVIIDHDRKPLGIITTRDILQLYTKRRELPRIELITRHLSKKSTALVHGFVTFVSRGLLKKGSGNAKILVKEKKDRGMFEAVVSLFDGRRIVKHVTKEGHNLSNILKEVRNKIRGK